MVAERALEHALHAEARTRDELPKILEPAWDRADAARES
jgi:hypothetical protein